jgi:hypothetical protein
VQLERTALGRSGRLERAALHVEQRLAVLQLENSLGGAQRLRP